MVIHRKPVRTCIGCRQRATAADLLRVVAVPGSTDRPDLVVPDARQRIPGRGAWLHPDPGCVRLAQRRRAWSRVLRAPGGLDPTPVIEYLAAVQVGVPAHPFHQPTESTPSRSSTDCVDTSRSSTQAGDDRPMDAR